VEWLASSCNAFDVGVLVFDEGDVAREKKDCVALTVPLVQHFLSGRLRHYVTRVRPGWMHFDIQHRSLRKEQAYFYHYAAKNILPPRRYNRRL
jgi:hypothetical protein